MEWLRRLWQEAQYVLREMSMVQRVVVSLFIATLALWLTFSVWWGSDRKEVGKIPLAGEVSAADYAQVIERLSGAGFDAEYDPNARRVLVPMEQSQDAYLFMVSNELIADEHNFGFEEMLNQWSFADSRSKSEEAKRIARENALSRLIERFDAIQEARVIYSDEARSSLFTGPYPKSASVQVKTKLGKALSDQLAQTIIHIVTNSKAGLLPRDVVLADQTTGITHRAEDENSPGSLGRRKWDIQQALDDSLRRQLEETVHRAVGVNINYGGGILVMPRHEVDANYVEEAERVMLEGIATTVESRKFESSTDERPAAEPGTRPNVLTARQMSDNIMAGRVSQERASEKSSRKLITPGTRERITKFTPAVKDVMISAIINLPFVLERDEEGRPVAETAPDGRVLQDPEHGGTYWKRKSAEFLPDDRMQEIGRALARVAMISDADIPEKIHLMQVPWQAPVMPILPPAGGFAQMWDQARQLVVPMALGLILLGAAALLWNESRRHKPTEADEEVDEEEITVSLAPPKEAEDSFAAEMEANRIRVQEAVLEDPERAASLVRRWMTKDN